MFIRITALVGLAGIALAAVMAATPAQALSSHDCSVKYKAAQDAGTLNGMKYADFRKANCGADATADTTTTTTSTTATTPATKPASTPPAKPAPTVAADDGEPDVTNTEHASEPTVAPTTIAPKGVVFPKAVDPKYASESAGKARMHTCLDQYHTNKNNNALGGLKWIQKGGGYYSLCNAALKKG